ncbi:zinc-finger-containing protein [Mesorhizobium sp. ES1-1]|uniref:zinc-finger-containing protein n=1 Tax=Mesorhizobium sp. ES1-1 TaxID=2876629 RepID=UPI001CD024E0|nr:hypothetical protein [Mesorhizobium sp. ES1-1]
MEIFCCQCQAEITPRLTDGREIYPHRADLSDLPFWKCDTCKGYVGCHHKTATRTKPLGNIASGEMKKARQHIHALIDPAWRFGGISRRAIYGKLSVRLGYEYHTGELKTLEQARAVYRMAKEVLAELAPARKAA